MQKTVKTLTSQQSFLQSIGPQTLGCLWVSELSLSEREKPFIWFNYLFDGILENHLLQNEKAPKSFFSVPHFNGQFFMAHIEHNLPRLNEAVEESLKLMKPKEAKGEIILLSTQRQVFNLPSLQKTAEGSVEFLHYSY